MDMSLTRILVDVFVTTNIMINMETPVTISIFLEIAKNIVLPVPDNYGEALGKDRNRELLSRRKRKVSDKEIGSPKMLSTCEGNDLHSFRSF